MPEHEVRSPRRIAALALSGIAAPAELGDIPELLWIDPGRLLVDETYQREINDGGKRLIAKIAKNFRWSHMKPPVVVRERDGFHVLDGQHTALAAASIGIAQIPVFLVGAPTVAERARAFVSHNTLRIGVTTFGRHKAAVAAGEEAALDVENVCARAGVRLRWFGTTNVYAEGDCSAVGSIRLLIGRRGVQRARVVLEACVKGGCAPIDIVSLKAAEEVLCVRLPGTAPERLGKVIRARGSDAPIDARAVGKRVGMPAHAVLADMWMRDL
jgi:hypothetical protein